MDNLKCIQEIAELNSIQGDQNEICEYLYLDYFNSFITVDRFAEYYRISVGDALQILEIGMHYNHTRGN